MLVDLLGGALRRYFVSVMEFLSQILQIFSDQKMCCSCLEYIKSFQTLTGGLEPANFLWYAIKSDAVIDHEIVCIKKNLFVNSESSSSGVNMTKVHMILGWKGYPEHFNC